MPKPKLMTLRAGKSNYIPQVVTIMLGFGGFIVFPLHTKFNIHFVALLQIWRGNEQHDPPFPLHALILVRQDCHQICMTTQTEPCVGEGTMGSIYRKYTQLYHFKSCPPHATLGILMDPVYMCAKCHLVTSDLW